MQSILALTLTHGQESQKKVLERSIAEASPTALLVWASTARTESISDVDNVPPGVHQMMAVGCEDGSIYILDENPLKRRRRYSSNGARPTTTDRTNYLYTTKPPQYLGVTKRPPRSSSPSSTKSSIPSPLQLSKSRVVSGVSTEQVEAPKNYVDFDDEPERLKGMLKGKNTKDKSPKTLSPSDAMQQRGERSDSLRMLMARLPTSTLDDSGTVLSTRSPSSTHSISSPPSPSTFPDTTSSDDTNTCWSLSFHIFPPWGHPGQIVSLVYSAQIGLMLCLHQRG